MTDSRDPIAICKTAILLGMGGYFAWLTISGNVANYVNLRFAWLVAVGAGIFLILGLIRLRAILRPSCEHQHQHYHISWDMLLIVALPLLMALLAPSRSLGIEAVNGGISLSPVGVASPSAFQRSPLDRNILDWLREFERAPSPAAFNGTAADVTGFVYREPAHEAGSFMLSRFTMSCCVADAFPIGMPVTAPDAAEYETGGWIRARGQFKAAAFAGAVMPVLVADSLEAVDEPRQPYLYP